MSLDRFSRPDAGCGRRTFLKGSAVAAAASLSSPLGFLQTKLAANDHLCGTRGESPYGPIAPARDAATGLYLIMLPRGFHYSTLSWKGDMLDDGNPCPSGHDGMALLGGTNPGGRPRGNSQTFTLIRNHEVFGVGHRPIAQDFNYDGQGGGGTTALLVKNGKIVEHRVSISGTIANCAGGPSPWGTWLTCEEGVNVGNERHGYPFECTVDRVTSPTPLTAMGRFSHEALAFDPRSGFVYLTEDDSSSIPGDPSPRTRGNSGFYMFRPTTPLGGIGSLQNGGTLYMLQAKDRATGDPVEDLRNPACLSSYRVEWIEITTPDAPPVGSVSGPYTEGRASGATRFQRLEGCWWDPVTQRVIFVDTEAGQIGAQPNRTDRAEGAIWAYDPVTGVLSNLFVSKGALMGPGYGADNPDNVSVSPNGGIMMCEDGGRDDGNGLSLLGLLPNAQSFEFARNIINIEPSDGNALMRAGHNPAAIGTADFSGQEWAGATFSPDGKWLFVNIQTPGITFAITGPWNRGPF